jgi:hypothetical protein
LVNGQPAAAEIMYPQGQLEKNDDVGDYSTYRGTFNATAVIRRAPGEMSPVEIVVRMQGFPARQKY